MSRTLSPVPRWAIYVSWTLSLIGVTLATYLTIGHFESKTFLACPDTGLINCAKVTTSAQSHFLGVPVALLGLGNFVVLAVLNSPWLWRAKNYWIHVTRFALAIVSMAFVLWLLYAELIIIDNICLYCTGVHVVTFALFVVLVRVCPIQLGWSRPRLATQ
ncbi:MAG TPA: vitamin K epoxide reductase family protein [Acidimicrobiales bacterium]